MTVEKTEVRKAAIHEVGVKLDDLLDAAKSEALRFEGAAQALAQGAKSVEALLVHVDKEVEEGKHELDHASEIKRWISRASLVVQNLAQQATNKRIEMNGRVQMAEQAVAAAKRLHDMEAGKAGGELIGVEHADGSLTGQVVPLRRAVGGRPDLPIGVRRRMEDAAEAKTAEPTDSPKKPTTKRRKG